MKPGVDDGQREDRRVIELATELLCLTPPEIEAGLRRGLAVAGEIAGAARVRLSGKPACGLDEVLQHAWSDGRPFVQAPAWSTRATSFAWSFEGLRDGLTVHVSDVDGLPAAALAERDWLRRSDVSAYLAAPLLAAGKLFAVLEVERCEPAAPWTAPTIERLERIAQMLSIVLQRRLCENERIARDVSARESRNDELEARLEIETRIADLSRQFVGQSLEQLDEAIHEALRSAASLAGADRCTLAMTTDRKAPLFRQYVWAADGISGDARVGRPSEARDYGWFFDRLSAGEVVRIARIAELPDEARAERDALLRRGTLSYLGIPIRVEGALMGVLGFDCMRAPQAWGERELAVLRLIADLFEGVLRRELDEREKAKTQRALEAQVANEKRIADLSRYFLDLEATEVVDGIERKLPVLGELASADRVFLLAFDGDGLHAETFDWQKGHARARHVPLDPATATRFSWARRMLEAGRICQIDSPDSLPEEAEAERLDMLERGVASSLVVPLVVDRDYMCVASMETTRATMVWSQETVTLLRLAGEIFASALRRMRAMVQLHESQAQLIQSQKMEAVGTLAGGIAHDFNNQLAVMLGNARFCIEGVSGENVELKAALEDIERAAQHCAELTAGLLAFSRHSPGHERPIDAGQLIAEVRGLVAPLLPATIQIESQVEPGLDPILGDPTQLQQVLINLVVNARDAMREGGHLTLGAAMHEVRDDEASALGLARPGLHVEILVRDDGVGMDADLAGRIFEPFFTTKEVGHGTGLGLATAYGIVQNSGGVISVESRLGVGSVFRVMLPAVHRGASLASVDSGRGPVRLEGVALLVEDEPAVRRVLARMLEARGLEVVEAVNGRDALRAARELDARLDVLVTDVTMPEMDGVGLARELVTLHPGLPVLFLSGYPDGEVHRGVQGLGPTRFIQKPFGEGELVSHLQVLLRGPS